MMMRTEVLHGGEMAGDPLAIEPVATTKMSRIKGCRTWLAVLLMMVSAAQVAHSIFVTEAWMDALSDSHARLISMKFPPMNPIASAEVLDKDSALSDARR